MEQHMTDLDIVHYFFLIIIISLVLNTIAIYGICRQKHRITSDYIKLIIFLINLAFTFISIPFYCVKESKLLRNKLICKLFHAINDFLIISYMNTYCFIAINRYKSVCLNRMKQLRTNTHVIRRFILVSSFISLISIMNFYSTECDSYVKSYQREENMPKTCQSVIFQGKLYPYITERYAAVKVRNKSISNSTRFDTFLRYFDVNSDLFINRLYRILLSFLIVTNLLVATCLYIVIIRYLFLKSKKFTSKYNQILIKKSIKHRRHSIFDSIDYFSSIRSNATATAAATGSQREVAKRKRSPRFTKSLKTNTSCLSNLSNISNGNPTKTTSISIPIDEVSSEESKQQRTTIQLEKCDTILPLPTKQFRSVSVVPSLLYSKYMIRKSYSLPVTISDSKPINEEDEILTQSVSLLKIKGDEEARIKKLKKSKPSYLRKYKHWKSAKLFFSLILTFLLITVPWFLTMYELICYYELLYYLYCMEVIISPLIHFLFNCKMS